jgi:hypothetical protein
MSVEISQGLLSGGPEYNVRLGRNEGTICTLRNITNCQRAVYNVNSPVKVWYVLQNSPPYNERHD